MADDAVQPDARAGGGRDGLLQASLGYFAEHGVGDASMRQIAAAIGTSHRMLIYHFGSREGLLTAVVDELEKAERATLDEITGRQGESLRRLGWDFWTHVADVVEFYGPLYFELASRAMRAPSLDAPLRVPNVEMWLEALGDLWEKFGAGGAQARVLARLNLAVSRGLLHDLLLTGDRKAVDDAMAMFDWLALGDTSMKPAAPVGRASRRWRRISG
jgi:AcrR family transcriptional regulator